MAVTLEYLLLKFGDLESNILKEMQATKNDLVACVHEVATDVVRLTSTSETHARDISEIKKEFRRYKRDENKKTPRSPRPDSCDRVKNETISKFRTTVSVTALKFYASMGAFCAGTILTVLNLLGVF